MEMYAPFAIRQKPAKTWATYRTMVVPSEPTTIAPSGTTLPKIGPSQTTTAGYGFGATSVLEMVKGWMEHDTLNRATRNQGADHVAKFVDGHHGEPV